MPAKSPARRHLEQLLADGNWHDREPIVLDLIPLVPPGVASRAANRRRSQERATRGNNHGPAAPQHSRPADDQVVGARDKIGDVINTALRHGAVERRTVDGVVQLRRRVEKKVPS